MIFFYMVKMSSLKRKIKLIEGDIRNIDLLKKSIRNHDVVIHLACISNDPSFELNPNLGKSINYDAFEPLVKASLESGVKGLYMPPLQAFMVLNLSQM